MTAAKRPRGRPFAPGTSGNSKGRPRGSRSRAALVLERLIAADAETILKAILTLAKAGDLGACKWALERLIPVAKDRPISIDLPDTGTAEGIERAQAEIVAAVADGRLLPSEGESLSGLVEARRRGIETNELAARVAELEQRGKAG